VAANVDKHTTEANDRSLIHPPLRRLLSLRRCWSPRPRCDRRLRKWFRDDLLAGAAGVAV